MKANGEYTYREIVEQPAAWREALALFSARRQQILAAWQTVQPVQVIFTGCGSTHYLSMTAAALLQTLTGIPARAVPASEILLFPRAAIANPERTLLVAISRSGTTSETVAAIGKFRALGGRASWGISCYPETPVSQDTDFSLVIPAGQEQSVAQTRSFASMLVLVQAVAALLGAQDAAPLQALPAAGEQILATVEPMVQALAAREDLRQFFFLGSGYQFGMASEAMLKMKEMSLTTSEAYHFMEFRHGPKSMVDEHTAVVGLLSSSAWAMEDAVLGETAALKATILRVGPNAEPGNGPAAVLSANVPEWALPVLYLPPLQLLAFHRAIARGLDPDQPRNLDAVVYLSL